MRGLTLVMDSRGVTRLSEFMRRLRAVQYTRCGAEHAICDNARQAPAVIQRKAQMLVRHPMRASGLLLHAPRG